ncbi:prefoldin subunit 1 [Copidosoma floridanum]|uniref:prefoldin subunit 1 n=1 Tax=Copidosoma floridanum TaxID=29053 RepID=UPI0006C95DAD|nr:prefoldin subunit 1 [Copidosoma floridanum]XP_014218922.1 prefoldin subunit 1 [Copidosoma floridanum]XP_014218923.1 prefoldin subunit 1 [Copidosoma floridanum]
MARVPDEELKKAFAELHEKVIDTRQKLKLADIQIESLKRSKQRAELTQIELRSLPDKTKIYESVGRMFLLQDIGTIKTEMNKRTKTADSKIKSLETNKEYLQKNLKESENNIREMVQKKQNEEAS